MIELDDAIVLVNQRFQNVWRMGAIQYRHYTQRDLDDLRAVLIQDLTRINKESHHEPESNQDRSRRVGGVP
ncbi:hypothetical protein LCGC14_2071510 [marine sediment metagenome]|uniref:Uncharacterized protein n=1 Tax=marine sediment metagenome TaxID=412755 RepID=A0A0F9EI83_9ZZZZ